MDLYFFFFFLVFFFFFLPKMCLLLLLLNSRIKTTHEVINSKVTNQIRNIECYGRIFQFSL